ncbi:hypothetical protein FOZ63_011251 [Perkinsus olseni]|uniref:Uncharacterized protein n=1 Tax=Perkinsus olseni TaxID=32597 RepID=A0A7J6UF46_PEROL|nr:hypothetical protein FOZ63_011251 [Perkinsus olseni]
MLHHHNLIIGSLLLLLPIRDTIGKYAHDDWEEMMAADPNDDDDDDYYFALPQDDDAKKKYDCDYFSDGVDKKNDRGWKAGKVACMANAEGKFGNEWDADVHEELLHLTQSGQMSDIYDTVLQKTSKRFCWARKLASPLPNGDCPQGTTRDGNDKYCHTKCSLNRNGLRHTCGPLACTKDLPSCIGNIGKMVLRTAGHIITKVAQEVDDRGLRHTLLNVARGIRTTSKMMKIAMNKVYEYHLDKAETTNKVVILGVCLSLFEESLAIDFERTGESDKRFIMKTEREGEEAYTTMMEKLLNVPERYLGPDGQPLGNTLRVLTGTTYMALKRKGLSRHIDFVMNLLKVFDYPKLMYSGIPNNPTLPHQQHHPQPPSSSCITGPTGDIISRDESLERDADAHNADTFGCDDDDDYDTALNDDDDVMLSYTTQPPTSSGITLKEIGSHPTPHHPTPNISIGGPLEGPPTVDNNNNGCRSGYDRTPGYCMEAAAAADQASSMMMMMRDMPPPPGISRPNGLAAGIVVPPPPGIMTRRPPITLASSSYLPTTPSPLYSDIRRRMADLRPPPGIHPRTQEGDVTVPPPPPPSFIPPLHQPLLSTQEYDVTRMKMSSSSSIEQERSSSSSSASMQDTSMFRKGMGRDDKTTPTNIPSCNITHNRLTRGGRPIPLTSYHKKNIIQSALRHHHPAAPPPPPLASAHDEYSSVTKGMSDDAVQREHSSSWMTEEEKDMVMKSQLNQMADDSKNHYNTPSSSLSVPSPSPASHTGNDDDDDDDRQRDHQSYTTTSAAIHHTSNSTLGNKIYSSIQHPRRNLNLATMKDDCSSSTGRDGEHHNDDDDPRWIIEEGFLQMMDVDICDKELSVLHPMAVDRIIHTLDTRTALLSRVMKGLKVMMQQFSRSDDDDDDAVCVAIIGYRKGRLLIKRLLMALQYVLLPPTPPDDHTNTNAPSLEAFSSSYSSGMVDDGSEVHARQMRKRRTLSASLLLHDNDNDDDENDKSNMKYKFIQGG